MTYNFKLITDEQKEQIIKLCNDGYSSSLISDMLCLSGAAIKNIVYRNGLKFKTKIRKQLTNIIIGNKYGHLTVLSQAESSEFGKQYVVKCDCDENKTFIIPKTSLLRRQFISCGCAKKEFYNKQAEHKTLDPFTKIAKLYYNSYNDGDITFDDFLKLIVQPCYYCGVAPYNKRIYNKTILHEQQEFYISGLDRVDNSQKVHNKDNVVPCCRFCNTAKSDRSLEEFKNWIVEVAKHRFGLNIKEKGYQ